MRFKKIKVFIAVMGFALDMLQASKFYTNIVTFENHTNADYIVYKRPRPIYGKQGTVFTPVSTDWSPVLIVKAQEVGQKEVLLRDPEAFGSQLKLEPQKSAKDKATLPTFYLKGGLKMSGMCRGFGWHGPHAIDIAIDEGHLMDSLQNYDNVSRVRYCNYRNGEIIVHIYADGIRIENAHNTYVLDTEKVVLVHEQEGKQ
jgi:hypothetical protein